MPNKSFDFPAIPEPTVDPQTMLQTVQAMRQTVQTLTGQRNPNKPSIVDAAAANATKLEQLAEQFVADGQATARIIDEVEATANGISAGGKLKFIATAGPQGYYAQYNLALKAGNAISGFSVLAGKDENGNNISAINFTAEKFQLFDPTLNNGQPKGPTQVFSYFQGVFRFNVPVEVLGGQIEVAGCSNSVLVTNDDANAVQLEAQITTRPNAQIDIYGQFDGQPDVSFPFQAGSKLLSLERTNPDGSVTVLRNTRVQFYVVRTDTTQSIFFSHTHLMYRDTPAPGINVYRLKMINGVPQGPLILNVVERHR
jgi:hypothetical protein